MQDIKLLFALVIAGFGVHTNAQTLSYDFSTGYEDWTGDFSDYPVTDSVLYDLEFFRTTLPAPLNTSKYALKITGNNQSDDLFMFLKRKISGLLPNKTYQLLIEIELASNAPTNSVGVGGAPGEGVTIKAGASILEPKKVDSGGFYLMNIDKSNQSSPGTDMDTIGHVGVTDTTTVFTLINRDNSTHLFNITTDANGEVWVCIGTDSGFEATTTLYYNKISLTFTAVLGTDNRNKRREVAIYPNPAKRWIAVKTELDLAYSTYYIINPLGKVLLSGKLTPETSAIDMRRLPSGIYIIKVGEQDPLAFKIIKK